MPEFVLDTGTRTKEFANLDAFSQGYIEAAFFTESGEEDQACYDTAFSDLSPETLATMLDDCTQFNLLADAWLHKAYSSYTVEYDMHRAGADFWFTRNRHGAGFWDRGLGEVGTKLTEFAQSFGAFDLYQGDDGMIYGS